MRRLSLNSNNQVAASNSGALWLGVWRFFGILLFIAFFAAAAGREMIINTFAKHDSELFINLGMSISAGKWLGDYNELTLIKGIGYPLFLAAGNMSGLPLNLFQAAFYLAGSYYFSQTIFRISHSQLIFWVLLSALLLDPPFYDGFGSSVLREVFYTSLVLFFFGSLLNIMFVRGRAPSVGDAVILGFSLGVLWLTREEGVWVLPAMLAALALGLPDTRDSLLRTVLKRRYGLIALGCLISLMLVCLVGLQNKSAYGRFAVNELKEAPFQSALTALKRAAFPYWRPYVPVPREARLKIYDQSPTFARLRNFLDPDNGKSPWQFGCEQLPETCGDLAGDWFLYAVRDGAKGIGAHASAETAAQFYQNVADEVQSACNDGRLICATYLPSLVPPFTRSQIWDLPRHIVYVFSLVGLAEPVGLRSGTSKLDPARREEVLSFLNYPPHTEDVPAGQVEFKGWYYSDKDSWFSVINTPNSSSALTREPSPDIAEHFQDPSANQQRFTLLVTCIRSPCGIDFVDSRGRRVSLPINDGTRDLKQLGLGDGLLYFGSVSQPRQPVSSPRARFQKEWLLFIKRIQPFYQLTIAAGTSAFLLSILFGIYLREFALSLKVAVTLAAAVLSRAVLLILIDAFSFPVYYGYALPIIPLQIGFAITSLYALCVLLWRARQIYLSTSAPVVR